MTDADLNQKRDEMARAHDQGDEICGYDFKLGFNAAVELMRAEVEAVSVLRGIDLERANQTIKHDVDKIEAVYRDEVDKLKAERDALKAEVDRLNSVVARAVETLAQYEEMKARE